MNKEAADILHLQFTPSTFALGAKHVMSDSQKRLMQSNTEKLKMIASICSSADEQPPQRQEMDRVYARFCGAYKQPQTAGFSSRELRILIYSMYRMKNMPMIRCMVNLLDNNWRNRYFNGLLYFILSNWDDADEDNMALVTALMQKRLKAYDGKRDKYLILKHKVRYFAPNGPELLGISLKNKDQGQSMTTSLRTVSSMVFGMYRNRLDFQYLSRTITAYFERDALVKVALMEEILKVHNYDATPKRLLPAMILNMSRNHHVSEEQKEVIHSLAVNFIGDPAVESTWTLHRGTEEEHENLAQAREILNEWIKRKFITIFFDKCVHESSRKAFWLKHADLVWDFNIYCTKTTKALLLQDSRLSSIVESKVEVLGDKKEKDESALGMRIGSYYMIEFSDSGSIHIYKEDLKHPSYFYQLKKPHLATMQDFMLNLDEGKLPHNSGWEKTFERWLRNHALL